MDEQYPVVNQDLDTQQNLLTQLYDFIFFCESPCVRKKWHICYNAVFPVCVNTERGRMLKKVVPRALCMDGGRL